MYVGNKNLPTHFSGTLAVLALVASLTGCASSQIQPVVSDQVTKEPSSITNTVEQENLVFDCIRYQNGFYEGLPGSSLRGMASAFAKALADRLRQLPWRRLGKNWSP